MEGSIRDHLSEITIPIIIDLGIKFLPRVVFVGFTLIYHSNKIFDWEKEIPLKYHQILYSSIIKQVCPLTKQSLKSRFVP